MLIHYFKNEIQSSRSLESVNTDLAPTSTNHITGRVVGLSSVSAVLVYMHRVQHLLHLLNIQEDCGRTTVLITSIYFFI